MSDSINIDELLHELQKIYYHQSAYCDVCSHNPQNGGDGICTCPLGIVTKDEHTTYSV